MKMKSRNYGKRKEERNIQRTRKDISEEQWEKRGKRKKEIKR